jgi:dienelactone hydrolase
VREVLGFCSGVEAPINFEAGDSWEHDGVAGEELSWSVGYGPRTTAWVLKPAGARARLPGIVALHDHGGFKWFGKEKIARGPEPPPEFLADGYHNVYYGGRAYANALAREGFVVLVHDTFLWGSRRFPQQVMPDWAPRALRGMAAEGATESWLPSEVESYNFSATQHEHVIEKYCNLLGTTMAGVVAYEDRIAVNVLRARPDVDASRLGCIGLSGGGNRAALLQATHAGIGAAVVVGLMSTYPGLLDHNVVSHTWMLFPNGWSRYGDWPDLAGCRAPSPLLVQYDIGDELFTVDGMQAAHARLGEIYAGVGRSDGYTGEFYPGPHKFDLEMQSAAFAWLRRRLG